MATISSQQSQTRQAADAKLPAAAEGSTDTLSEVELLRTYLEPGCSTIWHEAADKQSPAEVLQLMGKFSWFPNRTSGGTQSGVRQLPVCCVGTVPLQCSRLRIAMAASDEPVSPADVAFTLAKMTSLLLPHMRVTQSVRIGDSSYTIEADVHCSALKALTYTFHRCAPKVSSPYMSHRLLMFPSHHETFLASTCPVLSTACHALCVGPNGGAASR